MAKTKAKDKAIDTKDTIINDLTKTINARFKDQPQVAYVLGDETAPTDVSDYVGTGSRIANLIVSNKVNGGWPCGKIVELIGLEGSGKSVLGAHALAETQKEGGIAVFIDIESATYREFLAALGVDLSKLVYIQLELVEDVFQTVEEIITEIKKKHGDKKVTILVDSIAAATSIDELESTYEKSGYNTGKAIIISKAMRKITNLIAREKVCLIFTNQLRYKMGVMIGDPYTTSGGKAIPFHATVRCRLKMIGQIKKQVNGQPQTIGVQVQISTLKNRIAPPYQKADFNIYFDRGIDDGESIINALKTYGLVVGGSKGTVTYTTDGGDEITLNSRSFPLEKEIDEEIFRKLQEKMAHKYRHSLADGDVEIAEVNDEV